MKPSRKPLFRPHALERYRASQEQIVWPHFASVRGALLLWAFVTLLVLLAGVLWAVRLPVYAMGPAIVVSGASPDQARIAVFLPVSDAAQVHPGVAVQLRFEALPDAGHALVASVDSHVLSPISIRTLYHLDPSMGLLVTRPAVVSWVNLDASMLAQAPDWPAPIDAWVGSTGEADVQIGTRRALSVLPLVGDLFPVESR